MSQHPTQDSQSELREALVSGGYRLDTNEGLNRTIDFLEAYITTRVKEAERLARIDELDKLLRQDDLAGI